MSDRWIRASEISEYVYCAHAWWLRRVGGYLSEHVQEMAGGVRYHQQHGRLVHRSIWARRVAYVLLFVAIAFLTFQLLMTTFG